MSNILNNFGFDQIIKIARELQNPQAIAKANNNPIEFFRAHGVLLPEKFEYEIHTSSDEYFYFVMMPPADKLISEEQLQIITAAGIPAACMGSVSCLTSSSTFSCPLTSASSFTTGSTASTIDIKTKSNVK